MSKELFKLILDKVFYLKNKHRVHKDLFPEEVQPLAEIALKLQEGKEDNYTLTDVWELFKTKNPLLTKSQKEKYYEILTTIKNDVILNIGVGEEVLRGAWKNYVLTQAADEIFKLNENKTDDWSRIKNLITQAEQGYIKEEAISYIEPDLIKMLNSEVQNYKWRWNYEPLNQRLGGLGPGLFTIIAARPDCGKTLSWVSLVFGPDGWLEQGAKVHVLCNEEPAIRTFLRGVCAHVGVPIAEVRENPDKFQADISKLRGKIFVQDISDFSISDLEKYCEGKEIDILIIDQLDKMVVTNDKMNSADALQRLYERVRAIGKKHNLAPIAITQASAAAQGKLYFGYECLNNSKTGKAGEGDFILCIGMEEPTESRPDKGFRIFNIAKNKSAIGNKNPVPCYFNRSISRISLTNENTTNNGQPR